MRRNLITTLLLVASAWLHAQGVEHVMVERYALTPDPAGGPKPLITYRIYVDLAPGYTLQMVYGDVHHLLRINTTTDFFNDLTNGVRYGYQVPAEALGHFPLALDSWLTIGAASDHHLAIPKELDHDGSILECPPYADVDPMRHAAAAAAGVVPICIADGLYADTVKREVVDFKFSTSYMDRIRGSELSSNNGAWAVLGGVAGATPENMVLIAQLTTTGEITFELNLQLGDPDHFPVKYVAHDAAPGEVECPQLVRTHPAH